MEVPIPHSAATKNFTVSSVLLFFVLLFVYLGLNAIAGIVSAFMLVFMYRTITCFLDVQEFDMKLKNEILKEMKKQTKILENRK